MAMVETSNGARMPDPSAAGGEAGARAERRAFRLSFAGLLTTMALASLDQNIVSTALPRIVGELGGLAHLSWVIIRQAQRHARAAAALRRSHRGLHRRLGTVRARTLNDRADPVPRIAGPWRRRPDGAGADGDRRSRPVAPARPLSGPVYRRLRAVQRDRAGARRGDHRYAIVALDLLCQPAGRRGGAMPDPGGLAALGTAPGRPSDRLSGGGAADHDDGRVVATAELGRDGRRVVIADDRRAGARR